MGLVRFLDDAPVVGKPGIASMSPIFKPSGGRAQSALKWKFLSAWAKPSR